jgi:hypothetical protein
LAPNARVEVPIDLANGGACLGAAEWSAAWRIVSLTLQSAEGKP